MKWPTVKLEDVCEIVLGGTPSTKVPGYWGGEVPWLTPKDMSQSSMRVSRTSRQITKSGVEVGSTLLPKNSVILSTRAPIGYVAINTVPMCTNQGCKSLIPSGKIVSEYLYYNLSQRTAELNSLGSGTTFRELGTPALRNVQIALPSLPEQRAIAGVLSALDDKIELNRKICKELEETAKLIYDYWFVQFDFPDVRGRPYRSSGGKMVYSPILKRDIPEGWKVENLTSCCELTRGVTYSASDTVAVLGPHVVSVLRGNNIEDGWLVDDSNTVFLPDDLVDKTQYLYHNEILMTMSSGSKKHVGKFALVLNDSPNTFGAFCLKLSPGDHNVYFVINYMRSRLFRALIDYVCIGTGINNLNENHLKSAQFAYPSDPVLLSFNRHVASCYERMAQLDKESRELSSLRDWLLPLLLSGQVVVTTRRN